MADKPDINRLMEFQKLILEFRSVKRAMYLPPDNRERENDLEHSYSLAMTAWFLSFYFPELNQDKLIRLSLSHDLVEVYAGDTFSYGSDEEKATKSSREAAALIKLKKNWPDLRAIFSDIEEYEARQTDEAKFIYTLDKMMPAMLNYIGNGHVWHKHQIRFPDFKAEKESKVSLSPAIQDYYKQLQVLLEAQPELFYRGTSDGK